MNLRSYLRGIGIGMIVTAFIMGVAAGGAKNRMSDEAVRQRARELGMTESTVLADYSQERAETDEETEAGGGSSEKEDDSLETEQRAADKRTAEDGDVSDSGQDGDFEGETDDSAAADDGMTAENGSTGQSDKGNGQAGLEDMPEQGRDSADEAAAEPDKASESGSAAGRAEVSRESGSDSGVTGGERTDDAEPAASGESEEVVVTVERGDGSDVVSRKLQEAGVISSATAFDTFLCEHGYDKRITAGTHRIPKGAADEAIAQILTSR